MFNEEKGGFDGGKCDQPKNPPSGTGSELPPEVHAMNKAFDMLLGALDPRFASTSEKEKKENGDQD